MFAVSTIANFERINSTLIGSTVQASTVSTQYLNITSNPWNITTLPANISNTTVTPLLGSLLVNINGTAYKILLYTP